MANRVIIGNEEDDDCGVDRKKVINCLPPIVKMKEDPEWRDGQGWQWKAMEGKQVRNEKKRWNPSDELKSTVMGTCEEGGEEKNDKLI